MLICWLWLLTTNLFGVVDAQWFSLTPSVLNGPSRHPACRGIVTGRWLNDNETFLPERCPIYRWSGAEAGKCLSTKTIVFVGDAFTRNLFRCFVDVVTNGKSHSSQYSHAERLSCDNYDSSQHRDYEYAAMSSKTNQKFNSMQIATLQRFLCFFKLFKNSLLLLESVGEL